jgi:hypothetical protein
VGGLLITTLYLMGWYAVWRGLKRKRCKDTCLKDFETRLLSVNNYSTLNSEHDRKDFMYSFRKFSERVFFQCWLLLVFRCVNLIGRNQITPTYIMVLHLAPRPKSYKYL